MRKEKKRERQREQRCRVFGRERQTEKASRKMKSGKEREVFLIYKIDTAIGCFFLLGSLFQLIEIATEQYFHLGRLSSLIIIKSRNHFLPPIPPIDPPFSILLSSFFSFFCILVSLLPIIFLSTFIINRV